MPRASGQKSRAPPTQRHAKTQNPKAGREAQSMTPWGVAPKVRTALCHWAKYQTVCSEGGKAYVGSQF